MRPHTIRCGTNSFVSSWHPHSSGRGETRLGINADHDHVKGFMCPCPQFMRISRNVLLDELVAVLHSLQCNACGTPDDPAHFAKSCLVPQRSH